MCGTNLDVLWQKSSFLPFSSLHFEGGERVLGKEYFLYAYEKMDDP